MENCGKLSKSEAEVRSLAWNKIGYDRELTECLACRNVSSQVFGEGPTKLFPVGCFWAC